MPVKCFLFEINHSIATYVKQHTGGYICFSWSDTDIASLNRENKKCCSITYSENMLAAIPAGHSLYRCWGHSDSLVQDYSNSSANALEWLQSGA